MPVARLDITRVRNLQAVRLPQLARINVIYGENGSGKTSILESVHLLGMARSFRGQSSRSLITHDTDSCTVFGTVARSTGNELPLGVTRHRKGDLEIRVAGQPVSTLAELTGHLPLQVINAQSFELLTGSPSVRRQFLDWGVFHVEHHFLEQWRRFQRGIKQRNNLLRRDKIGGHALAPWTQEVVAAGDAITAMRTDYFDRLAPLFIGTLKRLSPDLSGIGLDFRRGWDRQLSLAEALEKALPSDEEQGYTHVGPQRADVRVTIEGHSAAETLSRGQQKIVVCALKLAQGQLLSDEVARECVYLLDDLPAELDEQHSRLVCQLLQELQTQVFITCVEKEEILDVWPQPQEALAVFHVKQGTVIEEALPSSR